MGSLIIPAYLKGALKSHTKRYAGEYNALKNCPNPNFYPRSASTDFLFSYTEFFLVISRIEGELASFSIHECSDEEMH